MISRLKFIKIAVLFSLQLVFSHHVYAGPLSMLGIGGTGGDAESIYSSSKGFDFTRPARLLEQDGGSFAVSKEHESIINQTRAGRTEHLATSSMTRVNFTYQFCKPAKRRLVYSFQQYTSSMKYVSDSRKLSATQMYLKGSGVANTIAWRRGKIGIGYFISDSRNTGDGLSDEVAQRIELLDPAVINSIVRDRAQGTHVVCAVSRKISAGVSKSEENISGSINFSDSDDDYAVPLSLYGERRGMDLSAKVSNRSTVVITYNRGTFDSFDVMTHNGATEIGRWMTNAEFETKGVSFRKVVSPRRTRVFGFERYSGNFDLGGVVDIFGTNANLLAGYFLFNSNGYVKSNAFRYSLQSKRGNYWHEYQVEYSAGTAFFHFDSSRRNFILFSQTANENIDYVFKMFKFSTSIKREIGRDATLLYRIEQVVPVFKERNETPSAPVTVKKKTRGGTLQYLSLIYKI